MQVFLSYPKEINQNQEEFITLIKKHFHLHNMSTITVGVDSYNMDAPLSTIRQKISDCSGMITIALKRLYVEKGIMNYESSVVDRTEKSITLQWFTSPFCHIEAAMAYQMGKPILIMRERDVFIEGILDPSNTGIYMPEFNLEKDLNLFFEGKKWLQLVNQFIDRMKEFANSQ